jgi:membrane dipeptidase
VAFVFLQRESGMRFLVILSLFMALPLKAEDELLKRAKEIHKRAIVIDTHADTPLRLLDEDLDLGARSSEGHVDLPRMREGGLGAEFFSIYVSPRFAPHFLARGLAEIGAVLEQVEKHGRELELARTAADIRRIHAAGKIAALMGVEGGHTIENDPRVLDVLYRLGVRYMTLTWAVSTDWAGSSGDSGRDRGLGAMGRDIVARMNRLGMMVDISHVSDPTFWEALKVTRAPLIASHSCCRALCDHPRNLTDDMLRALAKNGGVAQINFYSGFLDGGYAAAQKKLDAQRETEDKRLIEKWKDDPARMSRARRRLENQYDARLPRPSFERIVDHIDHAVKVAGVDHVGLGSDFDGSTMPRGLDDVSKLPLITAELLRRGYKEPDIVKILGGNLLRVMEQAEKAAGR